MHYTLFPSIHTNRRPGNQYRSGDRGEVRAGDGRVEAVVVVEYVREGGEVLRRVVWVPGLVAAYPLEK